MRERVGGREKRGTVSRGGEGGKENKYAKEEQTHGGEQCTMTIVPQIHTGGPVLRTQSQCQPRCEHLHDALGAAGTHSTRHHLLPCSHCPSCCWQECPKAVLGGLTLIPNHHGFPGPWGTRQGCFARQAVSSSCFKARLQGQEQTSLSILRTHSKQCVIAAHTYHSL